MTGVYDLQGRLLCIYNIYIYISLSLSLLLHVDFNSQYPKIFLVRALY